MKKIIISSDNASKTNNGIFEGWGTSLCWWANRTGHSEKLTRDSAKLFFSKEGLGLNIMRYNIGGGDDPTHNHIQRTDSEMPGWWEYSEEKKDFVFASDKDTNQLNVLKEAYKAAGKDAYVEAFSNSPPYYMTVSGCSSGGKKATSDNIKKEAIVPFSNYLADVCKYINNEMGIKIKSLAAMNEPFTNYWKAYSPKQEGCFVSPGKMQSSLIIAVSDALKGHGLDDIIVTASDETNTVLQYIAYKMLSAEAKKRVDRISTHTYMKATGHIGTLIEKKKKNLWMSETDWSGTSGINSNEMGPALWLGEKIIEDINTFSPSAWVIWQIMAGYISKVPDSKGREDPHNLPDLTKGFWGTAFPDIDTEEIYLTQKYYAFGQFTKFIRPGMTIIHTNSSDALAAFDKNTGKLVIVALNTSENPEDVIFEIKGFDTGSKTITAYRTSGNINNGEHIKEIYNDSIENGQLNATLKAHSITTFIMC